MAMTPDDAIQIIAETIWDGPRRNFSGCLVPSDLAKQWDRPVLNYNLASDVLEEEYGATHYDLVWQEKGKTVRLSLMKSDCLGACIKMGEIVLEKEVKVGIEKPPDPETR